MPNSVDEIIVGPATMSIDGTSVGYTEGGVTVRRSTEMLDIPADQLLSIAKKIKVLKRMFVSTTMLQATLGNLRDAMAEPVANLVSSGSQLDFGGTDSATREHVLSFTGPGEASATARTWSFFRGVVTEELEHLIGSRVAPSVVPITFECLQDPDNNNKFGNVVNAA